MRNWIVLLGIIAVTASAQAEVNRTLFTLENNMPEQGQLEVGAIYSFTEDQDKNEQFRRGDVNYHSVGLYARYGITDALNANVVVPFNRFDPDYGDSKNGLGDVSVGLQLVAYESVFGFPYIIPHVDYKTETGDEDDGLGTGRSQTVIGISTGTVLEPFWSRDEELELVADVSYVVDEDEENHLIVSLSAIYELSRSFSLLGEVQVREIEENAEGDDYATYVLGGMVYEPAKNWMIGFYGGRGAAGASDDVILAMKTGFTFF